ncbi:MAG: ATP-binding protein [Nanoarchaeota archaeon]
MNVLNDNGQYRFFNSLSIEKELKPKNYVFNFNVQTGACWLEDAEDFKVPSKVYDVSSNMRTSVIKSFKTNNKNLGVLLTGNKGQGKSLDAKLLCRDVNIPVIIINKTIPKKIDFVGFFNDIKQDYCLFVDEFEKLFLEKGRSNDNEDYHEQEIFLSFMDGVLTNDHKVMFLMTTNDNVSEFFVNRPSRIKFLKEYDELPEELFNMIVEDRLQNKGFKEDLEENISLINMNIDLLISIIDDINMFNKPFSEFKSFYNYKMEQYRYEMAIMQDGKEKSWRHFSLRRKIKHTDNYINGYDVNKMIKFSKSEIVFTSMEWDEDKEGKDIQKEVTIKVALQNQNTKYSEVL